MTRKAWMRVAYTALAVVNMGLVAFGQQLAAGAVPLPASWAWTVPIISAMVVAATGFLPRPRDLAD